MPVFLLSFLKKAVCTVHAGKMQTTVAAMASNCSSNQPVCDCESSLTVCESFAMINGRQTGKTESKAQRGLSLVKKYPLYVQCSVKTRDRRDRQQASTSSEPTQRNTLPEVCPHTTPLERTHVVECVWLLPPVPHHSAPPAFQRCPGHTGWGH